MKVGILYNLIDNVQKGKDIEKIADNEVLQTVDAVKKVLEERGHEAHAIKLNMSALDKLDSYDAIFNLAESVDGETTAEVDIIKGLERIGVPFTGNGSAATEVCLDKETTKKMLSKNGIPTPQYQIFNDPSERNDLKFPLLVKPLHEDASIGINLDSYVTNEEELKKKVAEIISSYKQPALVEEYIDGQEINAAMIGNGKAQVLPLSEIVFSYPKGVPNILTFDAKWIEDSDLYKNSVGRCPADVDVKTAKKIEEISKKCYKLMGCKGYARIDFRVKDGIPYVIEVNPNPCINPNGTGFVRSSVAAGMDYGEMVEKILKLAK